MIAGYLALGGGQEIVFPNFTQFEGEGVGPKRGRWKMDTDLSHTTLSIPSRDKQVQLFSSCDHESFSTSMAVIDSTDGQNYRTKLRAVLAEMGPDFVGVVNNKSTSTHRSIAILTRETDLHFYGLFDTRQKGAYLVWAADPMVLEPMLDPLRFLLYRFPILSNDAVFIPQERICALWWTWIKRSEFSALQPFNALERRLFGQPLASE